MATKKRKGPGDDDVSRKNDRMDLPENCGSSEGSAEERLQVDAPSKHSPMPIVAIGSSAGGLEALQEFFSNVPPESGIGFVVVTHIHPGRESMLPELISAVTKMQAIHASDGTRVEPNKIIIARDSLLSLSNGLIRPIKSDNRTETVYHPIDHFFRSLADDQREHAIGIILSGSGNDGSLGLKSIKAAGGMIMVQSPESAKYSSMPDSAIATHLADYVLPPRRMPETLIEYCCGPYLQLVSPVEEPILPENAIQSILVRLRSYSGQDFTCYKKSTMSRRIQRRMNIHHIDDPQTYLSFLRENSRELDALMEELLISVTSFFRDPQAWISLADKALPLLISGRDDGQTMRVWVPGCATGEEAYSVAILLQEQIRKAERTHPLQIFATDLDERAIDVARLGIYPDGISADVSPERLKAYFSREDGVYRINKSVRDGIIFAPQNMITDPPFTRLDLIVCRNVLIYLDVRAQQHVLPTFHYALRPGGVLFLGSAESVGETGELFSVIDGKHKILRRKEVTTPPHSILMGITSRHSAAGAVEPGEHSHKAQQQFSRQVEKLLLERFVPCSIMVNERGTVIHVQGRSGMYFEPEEGPPRNNVLEMAREGLGPPLATAMRQARQEQQEINRSAIRVRTNGGYTNVDLTVTPVKQPELLRGLLLLTLQPSSPQTTDSNLGEPSTEIFPDHLELERELHHTRETLQTTIEELETSNEELKSSNEEMQSTNEELQSINEELETSKEEMQSLNEELNTINAELMGKVDALARINDDMNNLLNSMQVATIFLDTKLRVNRYTEQARDVVRLISSDIGRPLSDLTSNLHYNNLIADCERVLATLIPMEKEVQNTSERWFLVRLVPYRTAENVIEGLVMTILDIDRTKQAEGSLRKNEQRLEADLKAMTILQQVGSLLLHEKTLEHGFGKIVDAAIAMTGADFGSVQVVDPQSLCLHLVAHRGLPQLWIDSWNEVYEGKSAFGTAFDVKERIIVEDVEQSPTFTGQPPLEIQIKAGVRAIVSAPIFGLSGNPFGMLSVYFRMLQRPSDHELQQLDILARHVADIIEHKRGEEELRRSEERYRSLFESIGDGFCIVGVIFDDEDNPVDFRILETNPSFERQTGLANAKGKTMRELSPEHEKHWFQAYGRVAMTGLPERFENHAAQQHRWYEVYAWRYGQAEDRQVAILFNDITARKEAEVQAKSDLSKQN
jgi:two-component system, chemotaxis family, CheB/CheR fusion protein